MQTRTNNAVESFHAALRRRVTVAHPNLYTFLGHLQRATTDSEADVERTNRRVSIRRSKKKVYIANDAPAFPGTTMLPTHASNSSTQEVTVSAPIATRYVKSTISQIQTNDETDGDTAAAEPQ